MIQQIIKDVTSYIQCLLDIHQNNVSNSSREDNSVYLSLAKDEEESEDITELCDDIDLYYEERAKLKESNMKAYRYLECRALEMYKEENPEATDDECNNFLDEIRDTLDKVITNNVNVFCREVDESEVEDSEQTENFLHMVEEKLTSGEMIELPEQIDNNGKEGEK